MTEFLWIIDEGVFEELYETSLNLGFSGRRQEFKDEFPLRAQSVFPKERQNNDSTLLNDLKTFNRLKDYKGELVPLRKWLKTASRLAESGEDTSFFKNFLDEISHDESSRNNKKSELAITVGREWTRKGLVQAQIINRRDQLSETRYGFDEFFDGDFCLFAYSGNFDAKLPSFIKHSLGEFLLSDVSRKTSSFQNSTIIRASEKTTNIIEIHDLKFCNSQRRILSTLSTEIAGILKKEETGIDIKGKTLTDICTALKQYGRTIIVLGEMDEETPRNAVKQWIEFWTDFPFSESNETIGTQTIQTIIPILSVTSENLDTDWAEELLPIQQKVKHFPPLGKINSRDLDDWIERDPLNWISSNVFSENILRAELIKPFDDGDLSMREWIDAFRDSVEKVAVEKRRVL